MSLFFSILAIFVGGVLVLFVLKPKRSASAPAPCHICEVNQRDPVFINGFAFCEKHALLYQDGEWVLLAKGNSSPEDPEFGVRMYQLKKLLASKGLSSYIETRYRNGVEEIITEMELYSLREDLEKAKALSKSVSI